MGARARRGTVAEGRVVHFWSTPSNAALCRPVEPSYDWTTAPAAVSCPACLRRLSGELRIARERHRRSAAAPDGADVVPLGTAPQVLAAVRRRLNRCQSPAAFLDTQGFIQLVNRAWDRFAAANGGLPAVAGAELVGTFFLDHVSGAEVRMHYRETLEAAARDPGWPGLIELSECNSPDEARLVSTRLERVRDRNGALLGLALTWTVLATAPIARAHTLDAHPVRAIGGRLVACACCRSVQSDDPLHRWTFAPDLVRAPPAATTWTFCEGCQERYLRLIA